MTCIASSTCRRARGCRCSDGGGLDHRGREHRLGGDLGQDIEPRAVLDLVTGELTPTDLRLDDERVLEEKRRTAPSSGRWRRAPTGPRRTSSGSSTGARRSWWAPSGLSRCSIRPGDDGVRRPLGHGRHGRPGRPARRDRRRPHRDRLRGSGQSFEIVGWSSPAAPGVLPGRRDLSGDIDDPAALHAAYFRIDVAPEGSLRHVLSRPGTGDPRPWTWQGGWAGPGTLGVVGTLGGVLDPGGCAEDVYVWTGATLRPTGHGSRRDDLQFPVGVAPAARSSRSRAAAARRRPSSSDLDAASGTTTLLAPVPPPTAEVPEWW